MSLDIWYLPSDQHTQCLLMVFWLDWFEFMLLAALQFVFTHWSDSSSCLALHNPKMSSFALLWFFPIILLANGLATWCKLCGNPVLCDESASIYQIRMHTQWITLILTKSPIETILEINHLAIGSDSIYIIPSFNRKKSPQIYPNIEQVRDYYWFQHSSWNQDIQY